MHGTIIFNPGTGYQTARRLWQGCPTVLRTPGGKLFAGWYSGGSREPSAFNYNLLVSSCDGGLSWSEPLLVIESLTKEKVLAIDIELDPAAFAVRCERSAASSVLGDRLRRPRRSGSPVERTALSRARFPALSADRSFGRQMAALRLRLDRNPVSLFGILRLRRNMDPPGGWRKDRSGRF